MIQRIVLSLSALLFLTCMLQAQDQLEAYAKLAYENGNYTEAISWLLQLTQQEQRSEYYFNLGAAHQHLGENGYALAYYLRAQYLNPRSQNILNQVQQFYRETQSITLQENSVLTLRDTFNQMLTWNEHLWAVSILWFGLCAITALNITRKKSGIVQIGQFLLLCAVLIGVGTIGARFFADQQGQQAVIINETATVYSGPATDYLELYTLYETDVINIVEIRDQWVRFTKTDNRTGWITISSIEFVIPSRWGNNLVAITPPSG